MRHRLSVPPERSRGTNSSEAENPFCSALTNLDYARYSPSTSLGRNGLRSIHPNLKNDSGRPLASTFATYSFARCLGAAICNEIIDGEWLIDMGFEIGLNLLEDLFPSTFRLYLVHPVMRFKAAIDPRFDQPTHLFDALCFMRDESLMIARDWLAALRRVPSLNEARAHFFDAVDMDIELFVPHASPRSVSSSNVRTPFTFVAAPSSDPIRETTLDGSGALFELGRYAVKSVRENVSHTYRIGQQIWIVNPKFMWFVAVRKYLQLKRTDAGLEIREITPIQWM
jgi:hypothetical protein